CCLRIHFDGLSTRGSACTRYPHVVAMCLPGQSESSAIPLEVRPGDWLLVRAHKCESAAAFRMCCTGWKSPPGRPSLARPGVVITCCSSAPEWQDAVACSEVPAFRYEPALDQLEQETAEHGKSAPFSP